MILPICHKSFVPDWDKCADFIKSKKSEPQEGVMHDGEATETEAAAGVQRKTKPQGDPEYTKLPSDNSVV